MFDGRRKMTILVTCIALLLTLGKSNAASPALSYVIGCKAITNLPSNTLASCKFDRELDGYTTCVFICRAGYHIEGRVNDAKKEADCLNGSWLPPRLKKCVPRQQEVSAAPCLSKPTPPRNSFISCIFRSQRKRYTICKFICRNGYIFQDGTNEKVIECKESRNWLSLNTGDCLYDYSRNVTVNEISNPCSSRPQPPLNSFDSCVFDKQAQVYEQCQYFCKSGYYFYSDVSDITQRCIDGSWEIRRARDCIVKRIQEPPCWKKLDDPENSFSTCQIDNNSVGYSQCKYACKTGYYFHGEVDQKTQVCINGRLTPEKIGICVKESQRYSERAFQCFAKPNITRSSAVSCVFNSSLGIYTSCSVTCNEGFHFEDNKREKILNCVDERWHPIGHGNCDYRFIDLNENIRKL